MGCCAYRPLRKQIDKTLKPMAEFPKNAAMQGVGCKKLLDMLVEYEAPHVVIRLMGRKTTTIICKCVKTHHHSGIVMRSAAALLAELVKNDKNLKRARKMKVLHKLQQSAAEFPHDKTICRAAKSIEAALQGVYDPFKALDEAEQANDANLTALVMRSHPNMEDVQSQGSRIVAAMSRQDESVREKLREKGVVPLLVKALKNFPDNNGVLANTATAFRELGRDAGANRDAGRDGGIEVMVKALMNLNLWRETHQAILWGLSRLTDVESNIIHMKDAKLQFMLKELEVRKLAVYHINDERLQGLERRRDLKALEDAKLHKKEDEWERANPYTDFSTVHPYDPTASENIPEEMSAFEQFKADVEAGKPLYQPNGPRKFFTEAEEQAYIAKKKRLAQMLRDGSAAEEGVVRTHKKKRAPELQYELAGKAQEAALFIPQRLKNIKWDKYSTEALQETKQTPEATPPAEGFQVRSYEDTLDLLLGEKAAARRREAKRRKANRKPQVAADANVVKHQTLSGAYIG